MKKNQWILGFIMAVLMLAGAQDAFAAKCGNGVCNPGETCATCPRDCGSCCGNGTCQAGSETCVNCPSDCGPCSVCGDGTCTPGYETCSNCSQDCGTCPSNWNDLSAFEPSDLNVKWDEVKE